MEVIEDGNIMDRIPILLQRDLEYYQKNQTVLSETICRGVVGGRLDFPRNASFASVKIVLWLEEEFSIAFKQGSGMFVITEEDDNGDVGVAKTSDPDKFVQLAIKSSDSLLEHLHMLAQEALDHADLPVLTATLGAAALLKNSLYCYVHHIEDMGNSERHSLLQSCYKRYVTMSEAVGERVLDLHNRILSLYILQDSGGRPIDEARAAHEATPSVHGWWLYMNGSRKDLWDTVPPRMAQRIFAGMLNETLTILTVRYCQTKTTEATTPILLNDILNILLCVSELLPCIAITGAELAGLHVQRATREVRDVHCKCNQLFQCLVYRGAEPHFIVQAFNENSEPSPSVIDSPQPWFTFVNPKLFDSGVDDVIAKSTQDFELKTALGLELVVLLAQPQPSWTLLVKVLMMRNCHLSRMLLIRAIRNMSADNSRWPANGLWYFVAKNRKCGGFLCTADGYCKFKGDSEAGEEYARSVGALTYLLTTIGSKAELKSTLCYALEISGRDWASCLDKRQVWCDRRPPWLAGLLAVVGTSLQFIPAMLVNAIQTGASMYQTMSLCLTCISRTLDCVPRSFTNACAIIERTLPSHIHPVGGSILLQLLTTATYEEIQKWAHREAQREKAVCPLNITPEISFYDIHARRQIIYSQAEQAPAGVLVYSLEERREVTPQQRKQERRAETGRHEAQQGRLRVLEHVHHEDGSQQTQNVGREGTTVNGEVRPMNARGHRQHNKKQVRIVGMDQTTTSTSLSFDGTLSAPSSIALAIAEALCSIDEHDKHTQQIERLVAQSNKTFKLSNKFGLEDFPEFAELFEEGDVPGSNAERASDAAVSTSQILMTSAGRDSLRVMYEHLKLHSEYIYKELSIHDPSDIDISTDKAPLLYTMFHIGRRPFDQFLRKEWVTPWSALVRRCVAWWGRAGARAHAHQQNRGLDVLFDKQKRTLL